MGNHRTLFGKTVYMAGFLAEKRFGNKKRKIGIAVTCLLELFVENCLHLFPNGISIGFYNHTAPYGRILGEPCFNYNIVVPLRVVDLAFGDILGHFFWYAF